MNKALIISMQPQHAKNILNGKKTLELRTWIPKGYVGWVYVYVTKSYPLLNYIDCKYKLMDRKNHTIFHNIGMYEFYNDDIHLNGKVVFRFWFDDYIAYKYYEDDNTYFAKRPQDFGYNAVEVLKRLYLSRDEFKAYSKGKDLYAWHIKQLEIFDEPKHLSEFYVTNKGLTYKYIKEYEDYTNDEVSFRLKKAPQKMQWVYAKEIENEPTSEI